MTDTDTPRVDQIIDGLIDHARHLSPLVSSGDGEFHLRTLLKVRDWAYAQQPHQPGSKVRLVSAIDFEESWGWKPYESWLQPGAVGTVEAIWFNGVYNNWTATVRWDDDTRSVTGLFAMLMDDLEPAGAEKQVRDVSRDDIAKAVVAVSKRVHADAERRAEGTGGDRDG